MFDQAGGDIRMGLDEEKEGECRHHRWIPNTYMANATMLLTMMIGCIGVIR
jgi:hypothetical protein